MNLISRFLCIIGLCLFSFSSVVWADWRDKTDLLVYSPRYFGPNAFPIPELRSGLVGSRIEAEVRGEYHYYTGDKTKDIYGRVLLPFVKGRAGVEVSFVFKEDYKMTPETRDERNAIETESPISYNGDIVVTSFFQLLRSEKWVDAMVSINLKTASGGRLCDARHTDAASYWFDMTLGKNLFVSKDKHFSLRAQAMMGFYCWMTNDRVHRQNDAISYGGGLTGTYRNVTLSTDISGFHGYENNGDRPMIWRNNLRYEIKKNILSFRYNRGMKDRLYDTYSLAYIRCF
ncbi:hypothetical protein D0T51_00780 [Parabacteroides sp. 52]|uniref:hypothetical protein n=1 Tax=unclassified Parabacteroides TaxID=2649774 RepID=UPI0013D4E6C2|nr:MULTISPECIES: hypothetical protein [unclassified Parabacteroides]MDH6533518.1 hypothetical protein [Parabacteroides sp. PM5-20]NDV54271.1 hypothetical protein [Parabacteroides sp. 52]